MEKYIGDINIITKINYDLLKFLQKNDFIDDDNLVLCKYELAKKDAVLIKVNDKYFIDIDSLIYFNELDIEDFINKYKESNILLRKEHEIYKPYIGQLFVSNIKKYKYNDVKKLKRNINTINN